MVTCTSGLLPNISNIRHDGTLSFRNFITKVKNSRRPWSGLSPKITKLGMMVFYRLEISYWWLKIIFIFFSCPVTDQQPKNVLPISVATWNFLFIVFEIVLVFQSSRCWKFLCCGNIKFLVFSCHIWNMREVLVSCREKWNFFIADFHALGLKNIIWAKKKFPFVTRRGRCRRRWTQNLCHAYSLDHKT
jgi:hypothetical protein